MKFFQVISHVRMVIVCSGLETVPQPLMMEAETVSEMLDTNIIPRWLIAQNDFTECSSYESFKSYISSTFY
jgi:hypothetical protein